MKILYLYCAVFVLLLSGCNIGNPISGSSFDAIDAIEDGIIENLFGNSVDLVGTWQYSVYFDGMCEGLIAKGTLTVSTLASDTTKIGTSRIQGQKLDVDSNRNCFLGNIDKVSSSSQGEPRIQNRLVYLTGLLVDTAEATPSYDVELDTFSQSKILEVYTNTTSGVIGYVQYTR